MAFNKVLAAAWLAAWLAGCAQGRETTGAHAEAREARRAPVATLGPDDGLPFTTTPGKTPPPNPAAVHDGAAPRAESANGGQGNPSATGR